MRVTVGGQEFSSSDGTINVSLFTTTRDGFEVEANRLIALDSEDFLEHEVMNSGHTTWVSREARDHTIEVTVFAPSEMTEQAIRDHLAGA